METQKVIFTERKRLGDQLHQSVQTEDSSFSLSSYLATSQSLWIRNRMLKKKPSSLHLTLNKDLRAQCGKLYLIYCVQLTLKPRLNTP